MFVKPVFSASSVKFMYLDSIYGFKYNRYFNCNVFTWEKDFWSCTWMDWYVQVFGGGFSSHRYTNTTDFDISVCFFMRKEKFCPIIDGYSQESDS